MRPRDSVTFNFVTRHSGILFCVVIAVVTLGQLLLRGPSGHYDIFADAARLAWNGQNPYGREYQFGFYFYSLACAMYFFGLFAFLPYSLGLGAYMTISTGLFIVAATMAIDRAQLRARTRSLFFFLITSELIGAILNAKLEVAITAMNLGALALCLRGGRRARTVAFILLAVAANWKFQSLPMALLLLVYFVVARRDFLSPLVFGLGLAFLHFVPMVALGPELFFAALAVWKESLSTYILTGDNWLSFQQIFSFSTKALHVSFSYLGTQVVSLLVAGALAVLAVLAARRSQGRNDETDVLVLAGLAAGFATTFSPLSQSAGFILYAPLLLAALRLWELRTGRERQALSAAVGLGFFIISLMYSDFFPRHLRGEFLYYAVKPVGTLVLSLTVAIIWWRAPGRASAVSTPPTPPATEGSHRP